MKKYRTLLRVCQESTTRGLIEVMLPGWDLEKRATINRNLVEEEIGQELKPGMHLFCLYNARATQPDELELSNFEVAPEPDDDDGLA